MGGPGKIVEGDGMFVIGKRKCGVGRWHSKEHVYVCLERKARKVRRIVVPDKSADALAVFDNHILPGTSMCVDVGMENNHFHSVDSVVQLSMVPGPIHIDKDDKTKHTQSVESSHSGVKMRLRSGRGLPRHNLQSVMDLEDFIYNRTDGTPADIFKKIGDVAAIYCRTKDDTTVRHSTISYSLSPDVRGRILGLTLDIIASFCSQSVFQKASKFETFSSFLFSTQSFPARNTITGEYRAARIYDQVITWNPPQRSTVIVEPSAFNPENFHATCTCKYYLKETINTGRLCTHVAGQLRRSIFLC